MPTVRLPSILRAYAQGRPELELAGGSVRELLEDLERQCPGIRARVLDEQGQVRRYINLFLNGEDVRFLSALETPVAKTDRLTIVPAIAGG